MTVPNDFNVKTYQLNGSATEFATEFRFFDDDQIEVFLIQGDNVQVLVSSVDYSVEGAGEPGGGIITYPLSGPPGASGTLTLRRILPIVQDTSLRNQGAYFPENVEQAFDESRMIDQQQQDELDAALKVPFGRDHFDAKGKKIINLGAGSAPGDAVNRGQLDSTVAGNEAYTDEQVAIERAERIAADIAEMEARQSADASLQEQISGGEPLEASAFSEISWHGQVIQNSVTIPPSVNAWSFGPVIEIAPGQVVEVGEGSFWTIAEGEA